ncbi:mechanosensitive ion channel protein MscS [Sulfuriferula sp. AH1]|uniref:mechanosensitive ion channel family protein n=1 Tax=Sulfuriferula sp. AH1 TaxID=1985873 RepID=UPI000B3B6F79|nr:mechanosensitive ion channel family protein [Sulfuriferula sp. AH1]ARU31951.1 mechanosensitive ion channel protein MscS [Sulfuriferula sp. AH1]
MHAIFNSVGLKEYADFMQSLLHVVLILVLAAILMRLASRLIRMFRLYMSGRTHDVENIKRLETLGRVFRYIASAVISVVAGSLVLSEFGISIAPILATAGVVGVAVGFGAQSLIKDYFNGFFLLLENQISQGDVVEAGGKGGLVEEVTLRYVRLRDYDGNVHYIPNGTITTVTNMSRQFAFAVVDVNIAYREDIDSILDIMREVGANMRTDPIFGDRIMEDLEIAGVDKWADSAVVLRCRFKVQPLAQWDVRREFLRRMKYAFDKQGIEIPFPHLTVFPGNRKPIETED